MGVAALFNRFWFLLFILFFSISVSVSSIYGSEDDCVYTAYIRTGKIIKVGTDSIISLTLTIQKDMVLESTTLRPGVGLWARVTTISREETWTSSVVEARV